MYFVFKINLGAKIVESYKSENGLLKDDYLKQDLLNTFKLSFDVLDSEKYYKINFFKTSQMKEFTDDIEDLINETETLYKMYNEVFNNYIKYGDVKYNKKFIDLNNKCSRIRRRVAIKYPFLNIAYNLEDKYILGKYNIPVHYHVGKGINHIKKYHKLIDFLESSNIKKLINQNYNILYDVDEYLYIQATDDEEAKSIVEILIKIINNNEIFVGRMGKINILPVTRMVNLKGNMKSITFTVVYPNGAKDRHELLVEHQLEQLKELEGDESTTTISSNENLNENFINKVLNNIGSKGYLKKVETQKKVDLEILIKKVDLDNE
ncbi:hypothetical protein [Abyssicoccus albus]|uniref:hypothetical protein n=1 Tax=Abyssicoccus albus TaxID=1817405 RepID=UPI00097E378F|nr:hypothetical protein [Abyssicoccus albus]AQL56246.1 hypothetical protein BVH56_04615 [Abyssicoccus albus]